MGGSHDSESTPESRQMRSLAMKIIVPIAILTAIAMAVLWPKQGLEITGYAPAEQLKARVISVYVEPCADGMDLEPNGCGTATIELDRDAASGKSLEVDLPSGPGEPVVTTGDKVLVIEGDSLGQVNYTIVDHQRTTYLWMLGIAFVLALLAFGRLKGLTALLGLAVTFGILLFFLVPAILAGESPVVVAVVGTSAIALTVLYMTHGFSMTTTVAVLGTLAALVLTGGLALFSVAAMHLSGITDDVAQSVYVTHGVNMQGLLIASIMIGSLGVLDDVTVTQAATVAELSYANPDSSFMELYRAASRIG
ncbi:MAG: YibE/F family protein, partial [Actinomycetales bacterium]|nr:YibE/F family protein [Actinomycetales bacterium]